MWRWRNGWSLKISWSWNCWGDCLFVEWVWSFLEGGWWFLIKRKCDWIVSKVFGNLDGGVVG